MKPSYGTAILLDSIWPGLGHLYLRRWITGGFFLLATLGAFGATLLELILPLWHTLQNLLLYPDTGSIAVFHWTRLAIFLALIAVFWLAALVDLRRIRRRSGD